MIQECFNKSSIWAISWIFQWLVKTSKVIEKDSPIPLQLTFGLLPETRTARIQKGSPAQQVIQSQGYQPPPLGPRHQHFIDILGHVQGANEGNHDLHILQTHLSTDHLHSLMLWSTNFWGVNLGLAMESDGTWWNCILGVGTWDCPQELDGKTWKNNKPFKSLQGLSGASKKRCLFGFPKLSNTIHDHPTKPGPFWN